MAGATAYAHNVIRLRTSKSMNALRKLEGWALQVLDRVVAGSPLEDSRVELKATLIEPDKAARRIAGHANAAHGEPILWLIGVDEVTGIVGIGQADSARWLGMVNTYFQGSTPAVLDLVVPYQNSTILALQFETHLAPFLVRNPLFGNKPGHTIEYEVPWREGTKVRTARREDLLRILLPRSRVPEIEIISADLYAAEDTNQPTLGPELWFLGVFYVVPLSSERLIFPRHRAFVEAYILPEIEGERIPLWRLAPSNRSGLDTKQYTDIRGSSNELTVEGPGMINLRGSLRIGSMLKVFGDEARAVVVLIPAGDAAEVRLEIRMPRSHEVLPTYTYRVEHTSRSNA
jgi:hypothetical protein